MKTGRLSDFLRGFADGLDAAAGRDPVDEHAKTALALFERVAGAEDPDEVVVPTADVDEDQVIRLGLDLQEARREITTLRAQLAASPAPPFGPQLDAKLAEKNAAALPDTSLREQLRVSAALGYQVRWTAGYVTAIHNLVERLWDSGTVAPSDIPADVQDVVDNARAYADIWTGGHEKFIVEPRSRDLVNAVRALDGQPPLPEPETSTEATG